MLIEPPWLLDNWKSITKYLFLHNLTASTLTEDWERREGGVEICSLFRHGLEIPTNPFQELTCCYFTNGLEKNRGR
jgi:hypothetical protein